MGDQEAKWTGNKLLDEVEEASLNKVGEQVTVLQSRSEMVGTEGCEMTNSEPDAGSPQFHSGPDFLGPEQPHTTKHGHEGKKHCILTTLRAQISAITLQRQPQMIGPDDQPVGIQGAQTISRARKSIPIPGLDELSLKHQKATGSGNTGPIISVSGRYLSLVYLLVAVLLAPPLGKAVVVVDVEGRFQVRRILKVASTKFPLGGPAGAVGDKQRSGGDGVEETANRDQPQMTNDTVSRISTEDLKHLYVYKPTREQLKPTLESAEGFMLYGNHGSKGREWWGTIVIGGGVGDGDISCGWRGWLRVEGERVEPFQEGISVQEALQLRKERHAQVDAARGRLLGRSEAGDVRLN